ncbi:helicase associated domain-containing protein [Streptomyces sp. NPDC001621]|uniref:helicase associated domain-containing protein n=1 Tax=Streptomyces sp. NPDC001621 TaxID=3364594 RepID=UPI00368C9673
MPESRRGGRPAGPGAGAACESPGLGGPRGAGRGQLLALGSTVGEIVPGVTTDGVDAGRWLQRQHVVWQGLKPGQRERLAALGVQPLPAPPKAKASQGG